MAVADASLSTVIVSMSAGFSHEMALPAVCSISSMSLDSGLASFGIGVGLVCITPSTTHRGSWLPRIVEVPRIRIFGVPPTLPVVFTTDTPGITPCSIWSMLDSLAIFMSSAFTCDTAPTYCPRLYVPYPVTTTSSIRWLSSSITTLMRLCPL